MIKLVIICGTPASIITGKKVAAWWFSENGFDVEWWDVSPLYYSEDKLLKYIGGNKDYRFIGPNHKTFENTKVLYKAIDNLNKNVLILYLNRNAYKLIDDDAMLLYIQSKSIKFYFLQTEPHPRSSTVYDFILNKIKIFLKHKRSNKKFNPTGYFGVGLKSREIVRNIFPKTKFISIPSPRIQWTRQERLIDNDYIVFVDDTIEYSPDAQMNGVKVTTDLNGYYNRMDKLFTNIERWTNLPIVIAASGKLIYKENKFKRKIFYKKTFQLMDYASLIIGHKSTALEHNVKCKKPMLFVDDKSFTPQKRNSFKDIVVFEGEKALLSDKIQEDDIKRIIGRKNNNFSKVINNYFREDGINDDYRIIMAEFFKKEVSDVTKK